MQGINLDEYRVPGMLSVAADGAAQFAPAAEGVEPVAVDVSPVELEAGFDSRPVDVVLAGFATHMTHLLTHAAALSKHDGDHRLVKAIAPVTGVLYDADGKHVYVLEPGVPVLISPAPGAYVASVRNGEWAEVRFEAPLRILLCEPQQQDAASDDDSPAE